MMNYGDEFSFEARVVEEGDDGAAYLPSLWGQSNNRVMNSYESSPLLPRDHQYSNLSPRSRLQRIVEARKELMEMIQDMPESSYELSLKDMVDEHQLQQRIHHREEEDYKENDNLVADRERSFRFQTEAQMIKKQQNNKKKKKKKMQRMESLGSTYSNNKFSRSSSMDSEIFLIKMFFIPSCFGSTKKKSITPKTGSSKVSPRSSCDNDNKEPKIKKIFSAGEKNGRGKTSNRSSSSSSSNSDSITTSRIASNFSPGCWPFLQIKKSKPKKQSASIDIASE
ncbi:hypothetical protein AB3S75_000475 [Citrus x aurantiifolia]